MMNDKHTYFQMDRNDENVNGKSIRILYKRIERKKKRFRFLTRKDKIDGSFHDDQKIFLFLSQLKK